MRFYQQLGGFIFEFESVKKFLSFTFGRICGVFVFILILMGWYVLLYFMGYVESLQPLLDVIHIFI